MATTYDQNKKAKKGTTYYAAPEYILGSITSWMAWPSAGMDVVTRCIETRSVKGRVRHVVVVLGSNGHAMRGLLCQQACDIWAYGVLLYIVITGEHPFLAEANLAKLKPQCSLKKGHTTTCALRRYVERVDLAIFSLTSLIAVLLCSQVEAVARGHLEAASPRDAPTTASCCGGI
eukprot:259022-Amphidinium_carterae.1